MGLIALASAISTFLSNKELVGYLIATTNCALLDQALILFFLLKASDGSMPVILGLLKGFGGHALPFPH